MTQDEMRAKFEGWLAEYGDYSITIREMLWDSYQAATAESEKRIEELETALETMQYFACHDDDCEINRWDKTPECSCGYSAVYDNAKQALAAKGE